MNNPANTDSAPLDCGHPPSAGSVPFARFGSRTLCLDCAAEYETEAFCKPETVAYDAYLSGDGREIQTFAGVTLAHVTSDTPDYRRTPTGGEYVRHYVRATDNMGRDWYGRAMGHGMVCRLRLCKASMPRTDLGDA